MAVVTARHEVSEIPPLAAADVQHAPAHVETAARELIEEIDVDIAEERPNLGARRLLAMTSHVNRIMVPMRCRAR